MASRAQEPDLSYLPAAVDRISQKVLEARRPWQQANDRAKLVVDATRDAAHTLERLGDEPIWNGLSRQQQRQLGQLGKAKVVLSTDVLVEHGCDQEDAESLIDEVNRRLEAYAQRPRWPGAAAPGDAARQTIRKLAQVASTLAEEADDGIAHRQQREAQVRKLLTVLELIVRVLVDVTVGIAASLLLADREPQWASSVLRSVDELRPGLATAGLFLLTFTAAEQGAKLAIDVAHVPAWSAAKLSALAHPDWRPLSRTGNPALRRQLQELRAEPSQAERPAQARGVPTGKVPGGRPAAEQRPPGSPGAVLRRVADWVPQRTRRPRASQTPTSSSPDQTLKEILEDEKQRAMAGEYPVEGERSSRLGMPGRRPSVRRRQGPAPGNSGTRRPTSGSSG